MKRLLLIGLLVLGIAAVAVACDDDGDDADTPTATEEATGAGTIVEVAEAAGFTTLVAAVQEADLVETLSGEGPFTVFAPTDEAFDALKDGELDALLADEAALTEVLTYHVVPGAVPSADVLDLTSTDTVQGSPVQIAVEGETVILNGAVTVTQTDVEASNGVIHVIDGVLTPPSG